MKINKIEIKNLRCFEEEEIDLTSQNSVEHWVPFLGNNGSGKTTLLRAIALCLCEESGAAGLLDEIQGEWIKKGKEEEEAFIKLTFERPIDKEEAPYIQTTIKWSKYREIELQQEVDPDSREIWDNLFVAAYGANRRTYGTTSHSEYTVTDAIESLFSYSSQLQNPELILRRWDKERDIDINKLLNKLEDVLDLDEGSITLERSGIQVSGPWGDFLPVGAIGDGYQSVIAWILDMYGWKLLYEEDKEQVSSDIDGIVLVDEIEQHLHPSWQKEIVDRLTRQFPNIQFFCTTHSPIVAINSFNIQNSLTGSNLYHLDWDIESGGKAKLSRVNEPVNELDYDQLLASEAFGHIYTKNSEIDTLLRDMSILASKDNLTEEEESKLMRIKEKLRDLKFPKGGTLIERIVERDFYDEIKKESEVLRKILYE